MSNTRLSTSLGPRAKRGSVSQLSQKKKTPDGHGLEIEPNARSTYIACVLHGRNWERGRAKRLPGYEAGLFGGEPDAGNHGRVYHWFWLMDGFLYDLSPDHREPLDFNPGCDLFLSPD
ncbi:hypothetical protein PAAG_03713 [Paracoccidioides lutzii Pb01]|uniref:Uncharacterized protein n=1 Tax=Paracoccidioides lutzii (strain ATCC MYA-826 / Pb01) TaxID=502779 RepID=C1GYW9_PARBA|nr:hypothetical protein PAAG_03713 [Paracoccidioides lutzii Pb01]EEH41792.2 hypothetical protein PAAG_03713 [Paracoccidioides lutzii Pb01]